jgi:hypothetical protein
VIAEHEKARHLQHIAVTLRIAGSRRYTNGLRDNSAVVSHLVIEGPSGSVEEVNGVYRVCCTAGLVMRKAIVSGVM